MADEPLVNPIEADPEVYMAVGVEQMQARSPGWQPNPGNLDTWILEADSLLVSQLAEVATDVLTNLTLYWGRVLGVEATVPVAASGTTTWTLSDTVGHTIPAGTPLEGVDDTGTTRGFETVADAVVAPGSATAAGVQVIAIEDGAASNGVSGVATPIESILWVSGAVFDAPTDGGADAETTDEFLPRFGEELELLQRIPVRPEHFATVARRVNEVARALVLDGFDTTDNEQQTITGTATGGTGTLTWNGQTTSSMPRNETAANIRLALEALSNIEPGDIVATGGPLGTAPVVIEFTGRLRNTNVAQIVPNTGSLTGGTWVVATTRTITLAYDPATPATWREKMVTVVPMADDGSDVSPAALSELDTTFNGSTLVTALRERGFSVHVMNPQRYDTVAVAFSHTTRPGYDPATVTADAEAAVEASLAGLQWGVPPSGDTALWENERTVRIGRLYSVLYAVDGLQAVTALTTNLNGGGASGTDKVLTGVAPVPGVVTATGTAV
jgi:hypothetical protein